MVLKKFDNGIFIPLVVSVGMSYDYLVGHFENAESGYEGVWGSEKDYENVDACVNLVKDNDDDGRFKILLRFMKEESMTMRTIVHECFHVAMSICSFHGMGLGFNVGEDEHAAHIAGWAGYCVNEVFKILNEESDGKKEDK